MFKWMMYWVWWITWRSFITVSAALTLQNVIHQEQGLWIETKPLLVGTILMVVIIIMWSSRGQFPQENK